MTNNPQALRAAAAELIKAAEMLEHNDAIFKGKWKKGSKGWSGDYIERIVREGLSQIQFHTEVAELAMRIGDQSARLAAKYGKLGDEWREDLRKGFAECFRVLADDGVLVFKWNETQVKAKEVLALTEVRPLVGHFTGHRTMTHWYIFMKPISAASTTVRQK